MGLSIRQHLRSVCKRTESGAELLGSHALLHRNWRFPKIRGTILGVPVIRIIVFGVYIGAPLCRETTNYSQSVAFMFVVLQTKGHIVLLAVSSVMKLRKKRETQAEIG